MTQLDVAFVRSQFPAFSEPSLEGWAHFENAGGSFTCRHVIEHLETFYRQTKVQPYFDYPASQAAGAAMDHAYEVLAAWMNVPTEDLHIGPSTTQNTYVLGAAFRDILSVGDEIVVSNQDHEANAGVWRRLESVGVVVKEWSLDPATGLLDPDDLDQLVTRRTRLVAFPHASNVVAAINPVAAIARRAHDVGAVVVVDGVAYAPHGLPDIGALGADVYLFSAYKTWGPHQGVMTVKRELLDRLANQGHFFNKEKPRYRLLPAGPDHAQIAACAGIVEYMDAIHGHHFDGDPDPTSKGRAVGELFHGHEMGLLERLLGFLRERDDVRIVGPDQTQNRAATVAFVPLSSSREDVYSKLTEQKIMAGIGHFYGYRPLDAMEIEPDNGVIRLSLIHYTSHDDLDQLLEALILAL